MIELLVAIIGVFLTLVFGIYAVWVKRGAMRKTSLGYEEKECYSLFNQNINRLNIEVKYRGDYTIDNFLILFKGVIVNNGNIDIDTNMIYKPVLIKTTNDYSWLEANIINLPKGGNAELQTIAPSTLQLEWDLLKAGEQIEFEALVEVHKKDIKWDIIFLFFDSISFDFRITDVKEIQNLAGLRSQAKDRQVRLKNFINIGLFLMIAAFFYNAVGDYSIDGDFNKLTTRLVYITIFLIIIAVTPWLIVKGKNIKLRLEK